MRGIDHQGRVGLSRTKPLLAPTRPGQTFSEVIKLHFGPSTSAEELEQLAVELKISDETLDAIEEQIRDRSKSPA